MRTWTIEHSHLDRGNRRPLSTRPILVRHPVPPRPRRKMLEGQEKRKASLTPLTLSRFQGGGTIDVYESINKNGRFYIAPLLKFASLRDGGVGAMEEGPLQVARLSQLVPECQLSLAMVAPNVRRAVARKLTELKKEDVLIENIGNLKVYAVTVDVANAETRNKFGVQSYIIRNPTYSQTLDVGLSLSPETAPAFVRAVNNSDIIFNLSYVFQDINLDNRIEKLDLSVVRSSSTFQDLDQSGKELMSAKQVADAAANIRRDITSTVIEGLGTIKPESVPVEKLLELFDIGDTWKKDDTDLKGLEDRVNKQFALNIDPADFQPFRVQKKVIDLMNNTTDTATQRQNYNSSFESNKSSWNASGGFGIGPFSASGGYSEEAQKVQSNAQMDDNRFKQLLSTYHGVEYNTEEKLWRGVKIYDLQKVKSTDSVSLLSATYQPTISSGARNVTYRPTADNLAESPKLEADDEAEDLAFAYPYNNPNPPKLSKSPVEGEDRNVSEVRIRNYNIEASYEGGPTLGPPANVLAHLPWHQVGTIEILMVNSVRVNFDENSYYKRVICGQMLFLLGLALGTLDDQGDSHGP